IRSSPKNRAVLDKLVSELKIFDAWKDQEWINDGAAVRVSLISCVNPAQLQPRLNGEEVSRIMSDLSPASSKTDTGIAGALPLDENDGVAFSVITKKGSFDIDGE